MPWGMGAGAVACCSGIGLLNSYLRASSSPKKRTITRQTQVEGCHRACSPGNSVTCLGNLSMTFTRMTAHILSFFLFFFFKFSSPQH